MISGLLLFAVGVVTGVALTVVYYETERTERELQNVVAETPASDPRGQRHQQNARVSALGDDRYHE